jgi:hypothetical protein
VDPRLLAVEYVAVAVDGVLVVGYQDGDVWLQRVLELLPRFESAAAALSKVRGPQGVGIQRWDCV